MRPDDPVRLLALPWPGRAMSAGAAGEEGRDRYRLNTIKGVVRQPRGGIAVLDKKGATLLRFDVLTKKKSR